MSQPPRGFTVGATLAAGAGILFSADAVFAGGAAGTAGFRSGGGAGEGETGRGAAATDAAASGGAEGCGAGAVIILADPGVFSHCCSFPPLDDRRCGPLDCSDVDIVIDQAPYAGIASLGSAAAEYDRKDMMICTAD